MKSGYDQFFKNARQAATKPDGVRLKLDISNEQLLEKELRNRAGMPAISKRKKRKPFPWKMALVSFIGFIMAAYGFVNYEKLENLAKNIEISMLGAAQAESAPKAKDKKEVSKPDGKDASKKDEKPAEETAKSDSLAAVDLDHLQKLTDRKKELDAREEELNRVDTELQTQKAALEKRMKELEEMRVKISSMLEERVKVDADKVETLVQMYSNMKAQQAAKIFESMDEDLAVEILGKMKKKNAADVMNLVKAEKAQVFSEKFAGYKRK